MTTLGNLDGIWQGETGFQGLTEGLAQMLAELVLAELVLAGIVIERIDTPVQKPGTYAPRHGEQVDAATFPQVAPVAEPVVPQPQKGRSEKWLSIPAPE